MSITTLAPIKQALVQKLRENVALKAAVNNEFHEGFALAKTPFPFVTYSVHYAPHYYGWGFLMNEVGFDVFAFAENSVDADNLDALVFATLHDAALSVTGQSTLICRRVSSLSLPDSNEEGKKIYQVGGIYEVITDQPLPLTSASSFKADAVISL